MDKKALVFGLGVMTCALKGYTVACEIDNPTPAEIQMRKMFWEIMDLQNKENESEMIANGNNKDK